MSTWQPAGPPRHSHRVPCTQCDGFVERELIAVHPASRVCLECMPPPELQRLQNDLNRMQEIDRDLLPPVPRLPDWDFGLHYRPSRLLSGDFYDASAEDGRPNVRLLVGDVMGKGLPAALLRMSLLGALKALSSEIDSPAEVVRKTNTQFLSAASPGRLASLFYGVLDAGSGELRYANAGHLPPLLRRRSGAWEALDATGMVLGVEETAGYTERAARLDPGDLLVLYSDGITETENGAGEAFDRKALCSVVDANPETPVQALATTFASELERFAPGDPRDDRTLVLVRRTTAGARPLNR